MEEMMNEDDHDIECWIIAYVCVLCVYVYGYVCVCCVCVVCMCMSECVWMCYVCVLCVCVYVCVCVCVCVCVYVCVCVCAHVCQCLCCAVVSMRFLSKCNILMKRMKILFNTSNKSGFTRSRSRVLCMQLMRIFYIPSLMNHVLTSYYMNVLKDIGIWMQKL